MKTAIVSSLLSLGLLAGACGKSKDDNKTIQQIPNQLAGTYKTDCSKQGVMGLGSALRQVNFTAVGDFDRKETYFAGNSCTETTALTYRTTGTVQSVGSLPSDSTLDMLNFTVSDTYITPGTDALVKTLNTTKFCGKTDWALNQEAQVSALSCENFTIKKGDVIQDVYDDRSGTLYFGKKFALLLNNSGARPTSVDLDTPYHKQ
ncbi:MAG: hypothetical protein H7249_10220 [Chitinophagaceae bacterium]|nr:hypothetical protein [Oligoflexus sp.]